jgi:hypothetical protein
VAMGARACDQHFDMAWRCLADLDFGGLGIFYGDRSAPLH